MLFAFGLQVCASCYPQGSKVRPRLLQLPQLPRIDPLSPRRDRAFPVLVPDGLRSPWTKFLDHGTRWEISGEVCLGCRVKTNIQKYTGDVGEDSV